jgi:MFS family permease
MQNNPNKFSFITPEKAPVFYGYIIAIVGTIGVWASLPGQTVGVSTFTDPVKDALGLSRDQISFAYMLGTFFSSLFIGKAGKWYDKFGARWVAFYAAMGLALSLALCSRADIISSFIQNFTGISHFLIPASVMVLLFFFLRFSGQGVLTLASRNMIMKWFDALRGRVNAFSAIIVSLGFSASPLWISKIITAHGWQNAWLYMALGVVFLGIIIFLFFRDNPEEHHLIPDGKIVKTNKDALPKIERIQYTVEEAKKTRAFWMYSLSLSFYSFFVTGFTFHVVSLFKSVGYTKDQAIAIFLPLSIITVIVSLTANLISDWIKLKKLLYLNIFGGILASTGLIFLAKNWGVYALVTGGGIMGGLFSVLVAVAWPRFFGRKHLGAVSGKSMSMIVLASSIGPILFSFSYTYLGTYAGIGVGSIVYLILISIASIKANNPQ